MEKRKIYGLIIGIVLFVLMMLGLTYAYFYWSSSSEQETNYRLIVNKSIEGFIDYNPGDEIYKNYTNETTEDMIYYINNYDNTQYPPHVTTITFGKTSSTDSILNIYGQLYLDILTLDPAKNMSKTKTMTWTLTQTIGSVETVVGTGNFYGKQTGDRIPLIDAGDTLLSSSNKTFKFYLWFNAAEYDRSKVIGADGTENFKAEISASASTESAHFGNNPSVVLASLGLENGLKSKAIDYSTISSDADTGIYALEDDFGISYYFRGNVLNNYVKFANYYWRIVRINGDGSIRMIYDGTSAHANGASTTNKSIGNGAYQSASYNHNTYVGYMYGSTTGSTLATIHTNATNSAIKTIVDNWYLTNIKNKGFAGYVADAIYCNDRTLSSGTSGNGTGTTITNYGSFNRLRTNKTPILKCLQANDRFTLTDSTLTPTDGAGTNKKLTYPVGLLTADEAALAGAVNGVNNTSFYLRSGSFYYTMTPFAFQDSTPYIVGVGGSGNINNSNTYTSYTVRPVISLRADAINYKLVKSGTTNGTASSPFQVN